MAQILALVGEAYGAGGGIARYNRDLFGALAGEGRSIHILPRGGQAGAATPERVSQARPLHRRDLYSLNAIRTALRERPDVVFCGHLFMAQLAGLICRLTGARLIVQLHGIEAWQAPSQINRQAVAMADLVLCVSRDTREQLLGWSGIAPERAVVLSNTVDDVYRPGDRVAARARFGLDDTPIILSVGRLDSREAYKGQDRVIRALPALPGVGFLIAGDGDDRPRLEALARSEGVADRVRFLGQVEDGALPDLYRAADVFALPSTGEGFGIVFLEAMACGTAAVGLRAGGAPDALGDGDLGYVAEEAELTAALRAALSAGRAENLSEKVRARFGQAAFRKRVALALQRLGEAA